MKIILTSLFVNDQDKALKFYTEVLGFLPKQNFPAGKYRWISVVSPNAPDGVELVLEPNDNPASLAFQTALFEQGIPFTGFAVEDMKTEYDRLTGLGVKFKTEPNYTGDIVIAMIDDTCGNYIHLYQFKK